VGDCTSHLTRAGAHLEHDQHQVILAVCSPWPHAHVARLGVGFAAVVDEAADVACRVCRGGWAADEGCMQWSARYLLAKGATMPATARANAPHADSVDSTWPCCVPLCTVMQMPRHKTSLRRRRQGWPRQAGQGALLAVVGGVHEPLHGLQAVVRLRASLLVPPAWASGPRRSRATRAGPS
jgi:hypothetical protein